MFRSSVRRAFHTSEYTNVNMDGTPCAVVEEKLAIVSFGHCTWRRHFHSSVSVILGWRLWCYVVQCLLNFWWDWWRCWDVCTLKQTWRRKNQTENNECNVLVKLLLFANLPSGRHYWEHVFWTFLTMWHTSSSADAQMKFDNFVRRLNSNAVCSMHCRGNASLLISHYDLPHVRCSTIYFLASLAFCTWSCVNLAIAYFIWSCMTVRENGRISPLHTSTSTSYTSKGAQCAHEEYQITNEARSETDKVKLWNIENGHVPEVESRRHHRQHMLT